MTVSIQEGKLPGGPEWTTDPDTMLYQGDIVIFGMGEDPEEWYGMPDTVPGLARLLTIPSIEENYAMVVGNRDEGHGERLDDFCRTGFGHNHDEPKVLIKTSDHRDREVPERLPMVEMELHRALSTLRLIHKESDYTLGATIAHIEYVLEDCEP